MIFGIALLTFLILLLDIVFDYFNWYNPVHFVLEGFPFVAFTILVLYSFRTLLQLKGESTRWKQRASHAEEDVKKWKQEIREIAEGLSHAVDRQFMSWNFTSAEKEIGILILKGLSFKEIGKLRNTSERTVRQQTLDIYKKSSASGRAQFSAFFLEDLLLPIDVRKGHKKIDADLFKQ
jgi:DNA-binding CsgD family transcriptional regulator